MYSTSRGAKPPVNREALAAALAQKNQQVGSNQALANTQVLEATPYVPLKDLNSQERELQQMYQNAASPKNNETSWAQGAARLAQALVSSYKLKELQGQEEIQNQQRNSEMALLAQQLQGGDIGSHFSEIRDPELQEKALGLMQQEAQYNRSRQDQEAQYNRSREDKARDREDAIASQKEMVDYNRQADPVKSEQQKLYRYVEVANDPNAPPEIREQAKQRILQSKQAIADMSPSRTTVNVDTTQKAAMAGDVRYAQREAEKASENEDKMIEKGLKADEAIYNMNEIQKSIESGGVTNLNTTPFGKALETGLARLGQPNDSAAIADYIKAANQQLVDARQQFKGQGQITDNETKLLAGTVLLPTDTMEAARSKIHIFKQVYDRQKNVADLANQWKKKYGSTTKPAENGMTFYDATSRLFAKKPIISYEESLRRKAESASQAAEVGAQ
jgi:hypothetical protein